MVHALRGGQSEEPEVHDVLRGGHSEELRCRLRQKKVVFVGAPFCEGQNLAGTDLAPEAMRRAGVQKAAESLGWAWEDEGDLDFKAHFASRGIAWEKEHLASLERYRAWVASGMEINFSTWDSLNKTPEEKAEEEVKALREALAQKEAILAGKTEEERVAEVRAAEEQAAAVAAAAAGAAGGAHIKPSEVVNSRLIGTGLELVHTAIDKAAQCSQLVAKRPGLCWHIAPCASPRVSARGSGRSSAHAPPTHGLCHVEACGGRVGSPRPCPHAEDPPRSTAAGQAPSRSR